MLEAPHTLDLRMFFACGQHAFNLAQYIHRLLLWLTVLQFEKPLTLKLFENFETDCINFQLDFCLTVVDFVV